ncbi:MAG: NADH-quinone oxidoreductase subunit L [Porticoccaceae bacterium]|nr:NADH-quinone oxidoreductase subunit L [Porticoccaceae bacterium]
MQEFIWLIPLLPLLSAIFLMGFSSKLPPKVVACFGTGSVGLSAFLTCHLTLGYLKDPDLLTVTLWTWMRVSDLSANVGFHIDGLTIVMMMIITCVGFLIHLFSCEFMAHDKSYARYFAYLNMFVSAMLVLVMSDNLLLLYLGWEGVGVCSYLLVGFWYQHSSNGRAARKAFIVTRIGDTAMMLGLLILFTELRSLDIQILVSSAQARWQTGESMATLACLLLLAGAAGKSAQFPLHTWLPDAMAGPTPVSALIHAATMVTAGVYLIARMHGLFIISPHALLAIAFIGVGTSLMAAFSALVQTDIKRILAYSTISQIGYMFLALGVGAWSAAVFHLMTHAFFKALLFLGSGAIIHCLHHEHDIFKMGGLWRRMPITFASFLIGSSALAALPFTSGFFSKDLILLSAYQLEEFGPILWAGGLLGALITALYSFRLVFLVFFGPIQTLPDKENGWRISLPLIVLCILSLVGGYFTLPLNNLFPIEQMSHPALWVEVVSIITPLLGVLIAYILFIKVPTRVPKLLTSPHENILSHFLFLGWKLDEFYDRLLVLPYTRFTSILLYEPVDKLYNAVVLLNQKLHALFSLSQSGRMRWYVVSIVIGFIILLGIAITIPKGLSQW